MILQTIWCTFFATFNAYRFLFHSFSSCTIATSSICNTVAFLLEQEKNELIWYGQFAICYSRNVSLTPKKKTGKEAFFCLLVLNSGPAQKYIVSNVDANLQSHLPKANLARMDITHYCTLFFMSCQLLIRITLDFPTKKEFRVGSTGQV